MEQNRFQDSIKAEDLIEYQATEIDTYSNRSSIDSSLSSLHQSKNSMKSITAKSK